MKDEKRILGFYNYTVVLTYIGLIFGIVGIGCIMSDNYINAAICLMLAGVCDMFDGAIASTKKDRTESEKRFGIQIDSLCDLICFGVLPAEFVYRLSGQTTLGFIISVMYILCALIRLAYFNVSEENRQQEEEGARRSYMGLPVTTVALLLPAAFIVFNKIMPLEALLAAMAVLFLSPIKLKKPKIIGKIVMAVLGVFLFTFFVMDILA